MFEVSTQVEGGAIHGLEPMRETPRQSSRKGGKASLGLSTMNASPSQELHGASTREATASIPPHATEHPQADGNSATDTHKPADTELVGQLSGEAQRNSADQPQADCGHPKRDDRQSLAAVGSTDARQGPLDAENRMALALAGDTNGGKRKPPKAKAGSGEIEPQPSAVGEIVAVYRRYEDLRRARQRIELQAIATCRTVCGGDKVAGMKLYKAPTAEVALWLTPYEAAMEPLTEAIKREEKLLSKLGKALPVAKWADTVPGLSHRFLAAIVGECGIGPGEFKSVSAVWKRMGMAVINGGRQRRVTGDAALEHGYVARRRALMWNIGDQVAVRQGIRNPKDEEGNSTGAVAINEWGALYLDRKAYELAREVEPGKPMTPMHAHNRAKRYVEKRLLRELWKAWRAAA